MNQLREREQYRLLRKGATDATAASSSAIRTPRASSHDDITGEIKQNASVRTIVIPGEIGAKYSQKYVHKRDEWQRWYGLRNTVESSYSHMRDSTQEDLENSESGVVGGTPSATSRQRLSSQAANIRNFMALREGAARKLLARRARLSTRLTTSWA
ncbi:hypothetical protein [Naasia sp. SYSU D00057]|uniref:hypothetical protein n=1 Tax=Naasia sp. SYSU D00057 TaxID=2817380 RepID=UPI001B30FFF8|nr:hypothetical protein [Naasia sp. SYSU D00057]